jgi:hypothetical protein
MAEKMEIDVDLRTAQAVVDLQRLYEGLDRVEDATRQQEEATKKLETASEKAADAQGELAAKTEDVAKAAEKEAKAETQAAAKTEEAAKTSERAARSKREHADASDKSRKATEGLSDSLGKMAGQYLGVSAAITGALRLLALYDERLKSIVEAQTKLVGEKWAADLMAKSIMDNLALKGKTGEDTARQLGIDTMRKTALNFAQSANLIGAGASFGFDVREKKGADVVTEVGKYAARIGMESKEEMDQLFKTVLAGQAQGMNVKQILGQMEQAAIVTGTSDPKAFQRSLLSAIAPAMAQGVSFKRAVTQASAMMSVATSPEQGAEKSRMLWHVVGSGQPEMQEKISALVASKGLLPGSVQVGDKAFEARVAGEGEDSQAIRRLRQDLVDTRDKGTIEDEKWAAANAARRDKFGEQMGSLKRRGKWTPEAQAKEEQELQQREALEKKEQELRLRERQQKLSNMAEDLRQREGKLRGTMQGEANVAAWRALPLEQRLAKLKELASKSPQEVREAMGGRPELFDALVLASGKAAGEREAAAVAGVNDPDAVKKLDESNRLYLETSPAKNTMQAAEEMQKNVATVDVGQEYAARALTEAKSELQRRTAQGDAMMWGGWSGEGFMWSDDQRENAILYERLQADFKEFVGSLSPEEKASLEQQMGKSVDALGQEMRDVAGNASRTAGDRRRQIMRWLRWTGISRAWRDSLRKQKPAGAQSKGGAAGQASTGGEPQAAAGGTMQAPMAGGPLADAGGGATIIINQNVGNQWQGPGDDLDSLPGRLG